MFNQKGGREKQIVLDWYWILDISCRCWYHPIFEIYIRGRYWYCGGYMNYAYQGVLTPIKFKDYSKWYEYVDMSMFHIMDIYVSTRYMVYGTCAQQYAIKNNKHTWI